MLSEEVEKLRETFGDEIADQVIKNKEQGTKQFERMKKDFDNGVNIEESIISIIKEDGQPVAMSASMQFIQWFITDRAMIAINKKD